MISPARAPALLMAAAFLLAYLPDLGHGFVSDDFTWLVAARTFLEDPSWSALGSTTNFLRPMVTLSFALNLALFGTSPLAYGVTNLLLVLASALLLFWVCRLLGSDRPAALVASGAWMFNFHGINMSLLWISGRTSLLLTMFALLAAAMALRGRRWSAAFACMAALFAKEEAVALPFILAVWVGVRAAWPLVLPLTLYLVLRLQTSAFWPQNAPPYYRFTSDLDLVATNAAHYLDRGGTVFAVVALLLLLVARTRPRFAGDDRRQLFRGLTWFAAGYALTVWVPVRSSLYAVFPSVGSAVMLGVFAGRLFSQSEPLRRRRAASVLLVLPFLLWPVYRARNERWVELADLTRSIVPQMERQVPAMRGGTPIVIQDDDTTRANVRNAFGGQMDSAMLLYYRVSSPIYVTPADERVPADGAVVLRLQDGRLQNR